MKTWLEGFLQGGPREDAEVTKLAKERNFSDWHLRWAKQQLQVISARPEFAGKYMLRLPGSADRGVTPAPKPETPMLARLSSARERANNSRP